ncbi:MAG TPA: L-lactate permease [Oculatellaceae cyanobacterium]|jgi:lactate permease
MLNLILALSPIFIIFIGVLFFKKSTLHSSLAALIFTGLIAVFVESFKIDVWQLSEAVQSAIILSLSAILVIVPGLYLNTIVREQKYIDRMAFEIGRMEITPENKVLILLLGFLPAVESLTGFGVSLFIGIPVFFKLFTRDKAFKLSLLGMNIMPWGTLGLATVIGSNLIQYPVKELGTISSLTSFFVFPYIALLALYIIGGLVSLKKYASRALILGLTFDCILLANNYYLAPETAGVFAGIITGFLGICLSYQKNKFNFNIIEQLERINSFLPYVLILIFMSLLRFIQPINYFLTHLLILKSENVSLSVFTNPGIVLLLVALIMQAIQPVSISLGETLKKARPACLTILCFLLLSRMMLETGMIKLISLSISSYASQNFFLFLSPLIGMFSGFITGSNVGGNALLIRTQSEIGQQFGHNLAFAAAHNSGAGHMVFSSIPMLIFAIVIAKDLKNLESLDVREGHLLNFTLKAAIGIYIAVLGGLLILVSSNLDNILF